MMYDRGYKVKSVFSEKIGNKMFSKMRDSVGEVSWNTANTGMRDEVCNKLAFWIRLKLKEEFNKI